MKKNKRSLFITKQNTKDMYYTVTTHELKVIMTGPVLLFFLNSAAGAHHRYLSTTSHILKYFNIFGQFLFVKHSYNSQGWF